MSNFTTHSTTIEDLSTHYLRYGNGEKKVLLLHGWGSKAESWKNVIDRLDNTQFEVWIPDLPGFGETQPPKTPWGVDEYVAWVKAFMGHMGTETPFVFAHSFGGRICIKALSRQEVFSKKSIFCGISGIKRPLSKKARVLSCVAKGTRWIPVPHILKKILYRLVGSGDYLKTQGVMRETFKKVINEDLSPYIKDIKGHVDIIWGENDTYVPVKDAHKLHQEITSSSIEIIPRAGHNLHREHPARLAEFINAKYSNA